MKLSNTKLSLYSTLSSIKMRRKHELFAVEGVKSVRDTIGSFELEALIIKQGIKVDAMVAKEKIFEADDNQLHKLSRQQTVPDMIAIYKLPRQKDIDIEIDSEQLYVVLDGIQDPGNLGTIIRTCHWFGVNTIFASHDTVDVFNPKVIQSTMGSLGKVTVIYCDLKALLEKNSNNSICGTVLDGKNIFETALPNSGFLIFGNEGNGISKSLRDLISDPLLIPPYNQDHSESLNVGVATGITLALFRKQSY